MPNYKISGNVTKSCIVKIFENNNFIGYAAVNIGEYSLVFYLENLNQVTVVSETLDGQVMGYGEVTPVATEDVVTLSPPYNPISVDTTIYVSPSGSDVTGDGSLATPFATPHKAFAYLKDKKINSDVGVTISCARGNYNNLPTLYASHPDGDKITVRGEVIGKTLSSVYSSSGSAGARVITLNITDVSDISVGDYLLARTPGGQTSSPLTGGTELDLLVGCWKITAVDTVNKRITVASTSYASTAPSGTITGTVYIGKTMFNFNSGVHGIVSNKGKYFLFDSLVLVGDFTSNSTVGLFADNNSTLILTTPPQVVGSFIGAVVGFGNGVGSFNGSVIRFISGLASSNYYGARAGDGGTIFANFMATTGNKTCGTNAYYVSNLNAQYLISCGNNGNGVVSDFSRVMLNYATVRRNLSQGVESWNTSETIVNNITVQYNTYYGLNASGSSKIVGANITNTNNGSGTTSASASSFIGY